MYRKTSTPYKPTGKPLFDHAVVIGGSITGLTAARVLTNYFTRVTIVERDRLPETPDFRRGAPQARHAHTLPLRGQQMLEQYFPGLGDELIAGGAVASNGGSEMGFYIAGKWHLVRHHAAVVSMTCSRPLLEAVLYRRLADQPQVRIIQEQEVLGLNVDRRGQRVTGLRLRPRFGLNSPETTLPADIVVDASGRGSQAAQWLAGLGYTPPAESVVNAFPGYASRLYRRPASFEANWKTLYIRPTPPHQTRGGMILPIEDDRWYVTLIGLARDYPPTDEADFLVFAQSLPVPDLYEAIKDAEPLTRPCGFRQAENRLRHYEKLPRYLEGLLVCGDAVCTLNPVYAQGMTAAVTGVAALENSLNQQTQQRHLRGLAATFQKQLSHVLADLWQLATGQDQRWPNLEIAQETMPAWYRPPVHRRSRTSTTTGYRVAYL